MSEQFYDEQIAPVLADLAQKCLDNGLSMVAVVQYGPEYKQRGATYAMQPNAGLPMVMLRHCDKTAPNVDSYIFGLKRYCAEKGIDTSGSIYMNYPNRSAA
jgi:hypothetical protein